MDNTKTKKQSAIDALLLEEDVKDLVLYNDDVNTFDFVISTLITVCGHEPIQAEQSAHIVHHNGKCSVKRGSFDDLRPLCEAMLERGLSAKIK